MGEQEKVLDADVAEVFSFRALRWNLPRSQRASRFGRPVLAFACRSMGLFVVGVHVGLVVGGAIGEPLQAASLTNMDNRGYSLRVLVRRGPGRVEAKREKQSALNIAPGGRIEDVCVSGCVLRVEGVRDNDYQIEGNELLSIEDGALYYDGEIPEDGAGYARQP